MRKTAVLIITVALLQLVCLSLWAAGPAAAKTFTIGTKSAQSMDIRFKLPDYEIEKEIVSGKVWDRVKIEDSGNLTEIGMPELPTLSTMIAIPNHGQVTIELVNARTKMVKHIIPYPSQDGRTEDTPKGLSVNQAFYQGTQSYPQEVIKYSDPQILRDFRLVTVQIQPFAWNPVTQELEVREEIDFRLKFTNSPGINELDGPQVISPSFANIYESMILNFNDYRGALMANTPPRYLMIYGAYTDQTFLNKINEFAFWKKQKGADVRLVSTAVTGTTTTQIKQFIQNIYNDINARPDFIVLIGDTSGSFPIPTWPESFSSYSGQGDYPYQHLAGNDYLGDVFLGRISAESTSQLDILLSKGYFYEKNINVNTAQWLNKMLLVGDTSPSGQSCVYTNKYVKHLALITNPDYTFTELYAGDPSPDQMNQAINQGVGFFNYRGYIGMSGWSPSSSLINGVKLPHSVIITCSTGTFYSGTSTTEAFIRLGTAAVPAGAVTAIGMATSGTHTMYNNALCMGIWNGLLTHNMRTMGEALLNGKIFLSAVYSQNHENTVKYFAHWCNLMGDPTLEVYTGIPDTFTSAIPDSLPNGTGYLDFTILNGLASPVEGACVTVSQNNIIMARGYTDSQGRVYLFLNTVLNSGVATVTVSKHDFKPLQKNINITGNGSLVSGVAMIDDDNVGSSIGNNNYAANAGETLELLFSVRNTTIGMISNVTGTVTSQNPYVTITNSAVNFASIDAGSANYSLLPVVAEISPECPNGTVIRFDLHLTADNDLTFEIPAYITVSDAYMSFVAYQISDTNNQALDPNESVEFNLTLKNNGTVSANDLYGLLITQNDLVQVQDNTAYFGNILPGAQMSSVVDTFRLAGRPQLLPGTLIPMRLKLYNAAGFLQWIDFTLTVGVVTSTNPLGPDAHGYVIYDITDTSYEDCPTYQWVGIAPAEGGQGTALALTDTGSTSDEGDVVGAASLVTIPLPFPFVFYGISYDQSTVCSNGFIAMGVTENANYRNFRLPGTVTGGGGAPSPLIAPFWDDLITTGGGVFQWHDATNHRFIIEWYNCKNGYVQTAVETFQVILYDPVYYPTSLGDGPIKIQYNTFNNVDTGGSTNEYSGNYCTVGIQNLEQNIGLEYSFNNTYPTAAAPLGNSKALYITNAPVYHYTPHLMYNSAYVLDDNNNVIEPNESLDLYVELMNIGEQTAQNITTTLSCSSPFVTVLANSSAYDAIAGDSLGVNLIPFRISVSADCPDNQILPFVININTGDNFWNRTFNLTVEKPAMGFSSYFVNDIAGNNNGVADPGETVTLVVHSQNTSMVDTHNLSGMLTTSYVGITINNPIILKPIIGAGEYLQFAYEVVLDTTVTAGANVPFTFNLISADAPTVNQSFTLACGTSGTIIDFESTNGYFISESGWMHGTPTQTTPHSGSNLWATNLGGQYDNNAMYIMKTPEITLGDNATLTFWHMMSCQNYYDGGNVSISTDGGSMWSVLYPVGGYNTSFSIYSLGEQGYTNQVSWSQATFNLSQYAGSNAVIRWRFGSNASVQGNGWFIDDVMISGYFIRPGLVTGTVSITSGQDLANVKLITDNDLVTNPASDGSYMMFLPQGTYTLSASLPYHTEQASPSFTFNNQQSAFSYNFSLEYLAGPTDLIHSLTAVDSIVYLSWNAPAAGTYPVLGYKVYRKLGEHPFRLISETMSTQHNERPEQDGVYKYYVRAVYSAGESDLSNIEEVTYPPVGNPDDPTPVIVNALYGNYPNPFNPSTSIAWSNAKAGNVTIRIYNTKGQLVKTLVSENKAAGSHRVIWDGRNDANRTVSSGLYFYRLDAPGFTSTRKMMLLK
jgi:hypothetical protein